MVTAGAHLRDVLESARCLRQFVDALEYFTETVNPKGPVALSIAGLFELLNFQLNSDEVAAILDSNFDDLTSASAIP